MIPPSDIGDRGPDRGRSYDCADGNHRMCAGTYLPWGADEDWPCTCDCHPVTADQPEVDQGALLDELLPPIGDGDGQR